VCLVAVEGQGIVRGSRYGCYGLGFLVRYPG